MTSSSRPEIKVTTLLIAVQAVITVALAFGMAAMVDHFFVGNNHYTHELLWALLPNTRAVLIGFAVTPAFLVLSEVIPYIRERWLKLPTENVNNYSVPTSTFGYVLRALLSGSSEEILFRGLFQATLGLWVAAALFALLHLVSKKAWPYAASTFIYGVFLGLVYIVAGNLWAPMIAHMINNFVGMHPAINGWADRFLLRK